MVGPVALAMLLTGPHWLPAVLLVGWLAAYCFNYFLSQAIKGRRRPGAWRRVLPQLTAYGATALTCAAVVIAADHWALRIAPALAGAFVVNVVAIAGRNERAWVNDIAGIVASAAVGFAAVHAGHGDIAAALAPMGLLAGYFIGTVFFVKTMIRERGNRRVLGASVSWHIALVIAALALRSWTAPVLLTTLARAIIAPRYRLSPKQIGIAEAAITVAMMAASALP